MSQTILLTGATGDVGGRLRPMLRERYAHVVLSGRKEITDLAPNESFRPARLDVAAEVRAVCEGVDGIVHMGGQSVEAEWSVVDAANVQGMMNLFEGARAQGVKRVIFASSNHAIGMYPRNRRIGVDDLVRPDSRYGLSKVFGEALASLYADKHGMRCMSIRIGNVADKPVDRRRLSIWLHPEDLMQLCAIGLEHPEMHNSVVWGESDNARSFWDNAPAYRLGYRPKHRAEDHAAEVLARGEAADAVGDLFQGGGFSAKEFDGDLERTLWS